MKISSSSNSVGLFKSKNYGRDEEAPYSVQVGLRTPDGHFIMLVNGALKLGPKQLYTEEELKAMPAWRAKLARQQNALMKSYMAKADQAEDGVYYINDTTRIVCNTPKDEVKEYSESDFSALI